MSDASNPFKATLKAGPGYEAPWITVEADTSDRLAELLSSLAESEALAKAAEVSELFRAAHVVSAGGTTEPAPAATQTQNTTAPAGGGLKTCAHGVRKKVTGSNHRGPWTGFFCPLDKNDPNKCEVEWG